MKKHVNIPIFIPHLGCPNQCVFCNQRTISGVVEFDVSDISRQIDTALSTVGSDVECELAFFGGSFTGIDRELMINLLEIGSDYVHTGKISSIRCSTRPDYISEEIIEILKKYGVQTIELGLQSTNDEVLATCKRGHTREDEINAAKMIVNSGLRLVGQMMIGLPSSTLEDEIETAKFIINSGAVAARIYPTVVFKDTELCTMAERKEYLPITLDDAVERSARVLEILHDNNIEVIRIGLCASKNLADEDKYYGGPNHSALGELVEGRLYYNKITKELSAGEKNGAVLTVYVATGYISKAIGQKKINKDRLIKEFGFADVKFKEDPRLSGYAFRLKEERTE